MLKKDGYYYHMPFYSESLDLLVACKADISGIWRPVYFTKDGCSELIFTPFFGCKHCSPVVYEDGDSISVSMIVQTGDGSHLYRQSIDNDKSFLGVEKVVDANHGYVYKDLVVYSDDKRTFKIKTKDALREFDLSVGEIANIVPYGDTSIILTLNAERTISIVYDYTSGEQREIVVGKESVYKCCKYKSTILHVVKGSAVNERTILEDFYGYKPIAIIQETTNSL